jgi:hypothetical protein
MSDVHRKMLSAARHVAWLLALSGGCGKDPADVTERAERSVDSWSSSVRLLKGQRAAERVPEVYVKQLLDAAREGLDEQASSLSDVPPDDPRRGAVERRIAEVRGAIDKLSGASPEEGGRAG